MKDELSGSVDDILAHAARLGRRPRDGSALEQASPPLDISFKAVVDQARLDAAAAAAVPSGTVAATGVADADSSAQGSLAGESFAQHADPVAFASSQAKVAALHDEFAEVEASPSSQSVAPAPPKLLRAKRSATVGAAVALGVVLVITGLTSFNTTDRPVAPAAALVDRPAVLAVVTPAKPTPPSIAASPANAVQRSSLGIVTESADAANTALSRQLLSGDAASADAEGDRGDVAAGGWINSLAALAGRPRITVVRYDALQAARSAPASARIPALQVVAPVGLEPVFVVVRADSPMQYLHQLKGKHINTGSARSGRALTAEALYRGLSGHAVPAHALRGLDEGAALEHLAAGDLDAVVLIGTESKAWFAPPSAAGESRFKLLSFDADRADARKALSSFLPVQAAARALGDFPGKDTPTLAVMSFVVTARPTTSQADAHAQGVTELADALCDRAFRFVPRASRTPGLLRGIDPSQQFELSWPYSEVAQAAFARCGAPAAVAAARTSPNASPGSS